MEKEIVIALAGNPNCGKTTLFNALTGSSQYVGNWPGVTVEKKEGRLKNREGVIITDLPGIYSLSPYTLEEVVARNYLINERPDAILNIVDGTNLERNLYLTTQLIEIGIPVVVAINMMDIVRKSGDEIDISGLSKKLGCSVMEMSALREDGILATADAAISAAKGKKCVPMHPFSGAVEHAIAHIEEAELHDLPAERQRWYAVKIFERDSKVIESLGIDKKTLDHIEQDIRAAELELDDDAESVIINDRYNYIETVLKGCYIKKNAEGLSVSDKIDRVLTNRWLALPIFAAIMFLVYFIAVSTLGTMATDWTNDVFFGEWIIPGAKNLLAAIGAADWVVSLVADGILGGLAAPIGFAPQMAIVFFFLSILEDCGYMSRVAFIMDKIFRKFGLSGKSFIPFIIGSGCGVPAIMACRTIENEKDRRMTMMTATFIPCGAKLPVIALIAGYIAGGAWWVAPLMFFAGIVVIFISCMILKKTKSFAGDPAPFVIELPQYHIPMLKNVLLHVWDRVSEFLKKAGTVLFFCCAAMWLIASLGFENGSFGLVSTDHSILAGIGGAIAWIFAPLGFGSWQAVASSLSGFVAKESILTTLSVLAGLGNTADADSAMLEQLKVLFPTGISAISFLMFNLFNSPCIAAISTLAKEIGSKKYFLQTLLFQNCFAYIISLIVYQLGGLAIGEVAFGGGTIFALAALAGVVYLAARRDPNRKGEMIRG